MMRIEGGRAAFYQWDVNQRLEVENPDVQEVHFTNAVTSPALVCAVYEENGVRYANVPNILLQQYWPIQAYGGCGSRVRDICVCKIIRRERPADYVYTETEVKTFDALEKRIAALEEGGAGGGGGEGIIEETDPTVPAWAKEPEKPKYTAEEVGAASKEAVRQLFEEKADKKDIPAPYTLPTASETVKGGAKIGKGLLMDGEVLSVEPEGEFELIRRISIDTDVQEINMTHEPDGTECRYTDVLVRVGYNSSNHVAGKWVRATVHLADGTLVSAFRINSDSANLRGWQLIKTCRKNGYTSIEISNPTVNEGNITTSTAPMRALKQIISSADIVRVVLDRENAFMSGDIIEIYGVRA